MASTSIIRWTADGFEIREATLKEVETHFADLRPPKAQKPERDLSVTKILSLDDIKFADSARFGVKTANMATLRTFGFPEGTVPNGFGIPFYFYDEFMKHNGFYEKLENLLERSGVSAWTGHKGSGTKEVSGGD